MNPLYQQMMGAGQAPAFGGPQQAASPMGFSGMQFRNPMEKMQYMMQAMTNPAAFVKRAIPDLPDAIANNPQQILQYLQQTRGVTDADIQAAQRQIPRY